MADLDHVGITSPNPDALAGFWADASGYAVEARGDGRVVHADRCALHIVRGEARPPRREAVNVPGITHVCVQMRELTARHAAFEAAGAAPHCAPLDLGTGNQYSYVRDPEFNVIEIEGVPSAPDLPSPWIAHVGMAVNDMAGMVAFYEQLLGRRASAPRPVGPHERFDALSELAGMRAEMVWLPGPVTLELIRFLAPPPAQVRRQGNGYAYLAIAGAATPAAAPAAARADVPGARWVADPEGNAIALLA